MRGVSKKLAVSLFSLVLFVFFHEAAAVATVHHHDTRSSSSAVEKKIHSYTNSTMAATMWNGIDVNSWKGHPDAVVDDPEEVVRMVEMAIRNHTEEWQSTLKSGRGGGGGRRQLKSHPKINVIDYCASTRRYQKNNRMAIARCGLGFGRNAQGGMDGRLYVVTDPSDHSAVNPIPGTLRYAVIQTEPLWIIFARSMTITLCQELMLTSYKTIDGRGVKVKIVGGAGITLQFVSNVIILSITIQNVKPTGNADVRDSVTHHGWRTRADGDGISLFGAKQVWINHVTLSNCADGLIDAIMGSTAITISNCLFTHHNEVMLLGHSDSYTVDKTMQVTIAFNHFGEGLIQRMPRCRHGYFHVINNLYTQWQFYAIGGSANPTVNSQGNIFIAPNSIYDKQVTRTLGDSETWNWRSVDDLLMNGAIFVESGGGASSSYARASSGAHVLPSYLVPYITSKAGNSI